MRSITNEEIHMIVDVLSDKVMPALRRSVVEDIKGAVHAEAMNILHTMIGEEVRATVRKEVQQRVEVTVKVTP